MLDLLTDTLDFSLLEKNGLSLFENSTDLQLFFNRPAEDDPWLIILDLNLPYVNGLKILQHVRKSGNPKALIEAIVRLSEVLQQQQDPQSQSLQLDSITEFINRYNHAAAS